MATKALQRVLEQTIGKYVKNLDAESLNVAIWSGTIKLNSLELDIEAVNLELDRQAEEAPNLALPFKILSGGFQALNVEVPWKSLASSPVILRLSGLSIIVQPHKREVQAHDENVSIASSQNQRHSSIDRANKYREQANEVKKLAETDSESKQSSTFGYRLARRILENIQFEISDVHISLTDEKGSAGVVLDSLSIVTTDKDGKRTFVDRTSSKVQEDLFFYKALELKGFGIYLNAATEQQRPNQSHSYILAPLSFQANYRQADGNVCIDYSKFHLSSELSTVSVVVSRNQLDLAQRISEDISTNDFGPTPLFPEYRPLARVSAGNAHEWWKYSRRCIGRMNGRSSWLEFFRAFRKRKAYISLYKRHTYSDTCSWILPLSESELSQMADIEHDRSVSIKGMMLWRDLADARVDMEKSKRDANEKGKEKKSYFSSVFSSKSSKRKQDDGDTPVQLTIEELKDLEDVSKESFADDSLSKDSKLCDASFILESLDIVLVSYHVREIATLNMGKVDLGFNARADGAFAFNFDLFDLQIQDRATVNSLFPNVLQNTQKQDVSATQKQSALHLQITKSKRGDQSLQLRIAAFEAVASQVFFQELKRFVAAAPTINSKAGTFKSIQSRYASVDDISDVLVDAWKAKTEKKVTWVVDVDIDAPIIMVPETCIDSRANILILDLGRLQLRYGKFSPAKKVEEWFQDQRTDQQIDISFDSGELATSEFTFRVVTASDWLEAGGPSGATISGSDIIEPISAKLDFGIEQSHNPLDPPRICCMGVIPSISIRFSPVQGNKLFSVVEAWGDFKSEMNAQTEDLIPAESVSDVSAPVMVNDGTQFQQEDEPTLPDPCKTDEEYLATFFFKISLQRLSTTLALDDNNRLEAHLISVNTSTMVRSNGSSSSSLQMGWFWILDLLESDFTRKQRLLAHSKLTKDPSLFAEGEKYDMLEDLVEQGVFDEEYAGSTDLADISYQKLVSEYGKARMENSVDQVLDARFSSLFIHWNPQGVNGIKAMTENFRSIVKGEEDTGTSSIGNVSQTSNRKSHISTEEVKLRSVASPAEKKLLVKFKVESLDVFLNSAYDDLPLFILNVAQGYAEMISDSDRDEVSCHVSLKNMALEDIRPVSIHRQHRHLIDQGIKQTADSADDLFIIDCTIGSNSTNVALVIGSPQIVLIPDSISELFTFFQVEKDKNHGRSSSSVKLKEEAALGMGGNQDIGILQVAITHMYTCSLQTQVCSIVLVDLGSEVFSEARCDEDIRQPTQLAETVVLQGIFDATLIMDIDPVTSEIIKAGLQSQADAMEIFSAFGKEMLSPLQILEPAEGVMHFSMDKHTDGATEVEFRIVATGGLEYSISMHNAALLGAILKSLSSSLYSSTDTGSGETPKDELSTNEARRIERLSSVLEKTDSDRTLHSQDSSIRQVSINETPSQLTSEQAMKISKKIQVKITMPQSRVTVINDLQGLDEALFRISVANFVAGAEVVVPMVPNPMEKMTIDFYMNTSILADYFDSSINLWSKLLIMPWEVTLKVVRSTSRRFKSPRLSSTIDLESFPCHISFSQEFLVSLASATRMWSIYSIATSNRVSMENKNSEDKEGSLKESMAASAARNLLTSLPYAIENHCGCDVVFSLPVGSISRRKCPKGSIQYFRFQPPQGKGHGGRRMYGQDVEFEKSVTLSIGDCEIVIPHLDAMLGSRKHVHNLSDGRVLVTFVVREGKTTVLHLTSNVSISNHSSLPFAISIGMNDPKNIGTCMAHNEEKTNTALSTTDGVATKESNRFSIPMDLLTSFSKEWANTGQSSVFLRLSPCLKSTEPYQALRGGLDIVPHFRELSKSDNKRHICRFDVTCREETASVHHMDPFVVQVLVQTTMIDDANIYIEVFLEPRAVIENLFPIGINLRSPMPHTFSLAEREIVSDCDTVHELQPGNRIEVFTPGNSLSVSVKPVDTLIAGSALTWRSLDLPLIPEFRLPEPMTCTFPFVESKQRGSEFYIAEGYECLDHLSETPNQGSKEKNVEPVKRELSLIDPLKAFYVTVCCYGVDHTGEILFDSISARDGSDTKSGAGLPFFNRSQHVPFGAFSSATNRKRITPLPTTNSSIRLLQPMEGHDEYKTTLPFAMDDLAIGKGGIDAAPILWENRKRSGYFAYRRIINEHQSEIHIVPEFVVFNGSKEMVIFTERGMEDVIIEAGKSVPLKAGSRMGGLELALNFVEAEARTKPIRVDQLGLKVEFVHSIAGKRVGSVCVQTALDTRGDARLVVKIGEISSGSKTSIASSVIPAFLADDFVRFRVRWTELQLILNERVPSQDKVFASVTKRTAEELIVAASNQLLSVTVSRFSVDIQRLFKDQAANDQEAKQADSSVSSPERCQLSLIIHNFLVKDLTPESTFPVIFDSSSDANFIDFRLRTRGPLDADIVTVNLFDLSLAHSKGKSERIRLTTSEEYVWRLTDMMTQILEASSEFGGFSLALTEDQDHRGYIVKIEDGVDDREEGMKYTSPRVDRLYDVELAQVSPFALLVSFRRTPDESRYEQARNVRGAALTNYFTRKLKFSIDNAELKFARYTNRGLKGPQDRLVESLGAVYVSRMKFKVITLLSAASLQDWKFLAARDGDDEYVEGDILRATGNLAGMSAGMVLGTVGQGLGDGVSNITRTLGNGIEDATGLVGARKLGAGVNTVLSGVGDGVGNTLTGVGGGASKVLQGAGKGIGHVVGGVFGGAVQMGKGIGQGIVKGDGKALVDGVGKGANQIGGGLVQGAGSVVKGATDGVLTAGGGLVQGAGSVVKGATGGVLGLFQLPKKKK